jgi:hypothetical protein
VIVRFVDTGGIVDHHCLINFLAILVSLDHPEYNKFTE